MIPEMNRLGGRRKQEPDRPFEPLCVDSPHQRAEAKSTEHYVYIVLCCASITIMHYVVEVLVSACSFTFFALALVLTEMRADE
jgi:hypothetical protein